MTFSVEMDETGDADIVLLDPTGEDNDVNVSIFGNTVYIKQICPKTDNVDLIEMDISMLQDLVHAYNSHEGVFIS